VAGVPGGYRVGGGKRGGAGAAATTVCYMYQEQRRVPPLDHPSGQRGRAIATIDALNTPATTPKRADLVFDVGMHKGEDTDYYLKKGFRVIGFEAVRDLVDHCRVRFSDAVDSGRLTIVEGAIVSSHHLKSRTPTVRFYRNLDSSVWGTLSETWAARNAMLGTRSETIDVKAIDFAVSGATRYTPLHED
jgi:hypothetical protein